MADVSLLDAVQGMRAGLTAYYNDSYHYEIYLSREMDRWKVCLAKHIHDIFTVTASAEIPAAENVKLRIVSDKTYYRFSLCSIPHIILHRWIPQEIIMQAEPIL